MAATHKHPPRGVCRSGLSKPECDRVWREYQHFHPGERCVVREEPEKAGSQKTVKRCVLLRPSKLAELSRLHLAVTGQALDPTAVADSLVDDDS
jgi:hypothetical protein